MTAQLLVWSPASGGDGEFDASGCTAADVGGAEQATASTQHRAAATSGMWCRSAIMLPFQLSCVIACPPCHFQMNQRRTEEQATRRLDLTMQGA